MPQVKDPVCGMMIDSESAAARIEVQGQTYYFCSAACREAFAADPRRYAAAASAGGAERVELEHHEPPYTTWGFLTSPKFGSAVSGGLEYERLPEAHDHPDAHRKP